MTGGVRKRGNTWSYYFDLGKINGKRQKKEKGGFRTKKDAEKALADAIAEYNNGGLKITETEMTVADYLNYYFDNYVVVNLRHNTQLIKRGHIDNYLCPAFGQYKLKSLNSAVIQEFLNRLKLNGLSKSSIEGIASTLSGALDYAVEPCHFIPMNPCNHTKLPKVDRQPKERIILDADEWQRIINQFPFGNRFFIPLMLGYFCGLRISETFALTWDDVDFENKTITVNKQIQSRSVKDEFADRNNLWYLATPKTQSSFRVIRFGDTMCDALTEELKRQEDNENQYGDFYFVQMTKPFADEKNNTYDRIVQAQKCVGSKLPRIRMVCVDENGQLTTPDSFKYCARVIHHKLQIAFDYHSLRHTHATRLIEGGASPKTVQARLGHNNITTTMQTYVHNTESMESDAVEIFEKQTKMPPK